MDFEGIMSFGIYKLLILFDFLHKKQYIVSVLMAAETTEGERQKHASCLHSTF